MNKEKGTLMSKLYKAAEVPAMKILPEQRLLWAMLENAIADYCNEIVGHCLKHHRRGAIMRSAELWLNSSEIGPFSFLWTCDHLELSPSRVIAAARKLKEAKERIEPAAKGAVTAIFELDESKISHSCSAEPIEEFAIENERLQVELFLKDEQQKVKAA